ncbi:MAG: portal protein [Akkermansia sp.]
MMKDSHLNQVMATYNSLKSQRAPWESWWDHLREYVLPRRIGDTKKMTLPQGEAFDRLYDTTAVEACQKLASGHMSYITPSHEVWFKWSAPDDDGGDEAEAWYNQCSEIALRELSVSNFYTEIHECYLDRVGLGTGSLYVGTGGDGHLLFTNIPCGQFACAENDEGRVDTYYREFTFTLHQAERMFGRKALGPKVNDMIQDGKDPYGTTLRFLHVVRPRAQRDRRKATAKNMAYESLYISLDDRCIVEEGGYHEFPYLVSRFLKWGEGPYGLAPGRLVYPAIHQVQFLNRILDTLGEVAAFPRILELANQIGEIDLRAGGRTVITPEAASLHLPKEWATQGRYDIGMDRLKQKQEEIQRAYYLPMLELWANRTATMTATEVSARENERVRMFSPSFTLFVSDLYPVMCRIFSLLFRMGRFPTPPRAVLRQAPGGEWEVGEPSVVYQSKIALILRRLQSEGIDRSLQRLSMMIQGSPDLGDHVDWDTCFRMSTRFDGAPERMLRPMREVRKIRKERETAAMNASGNPDTQGQSAQDDPLAPLLAQLTKEKQR